MHCHYHDTSTRAKLLTKKATHLLQVSLIWRSILDVGTLKQKLTLGEKKTKIDDQFFTLHDLVPKLDLGKLNTRFETPVRRPHLPTHMHATDQP